MKFKFLVEDGYLDVKSLSKSNELIAWQLSNITSYSVFFMVEEGIRDVEKENKEEWHMSFNSTFLQVTKNNIRCSDLFDEKIYIDISPKKFLKILHKWKSFVTESRNKHNYQRTLEFD